MSARTIADHELIYVLSGSGFLTLNGRERPVKQDNLFLLLPGIPHSLRADKSDPFNLLFAHFDAFLKGGGKYPLRRLELPEVVSVPRGLGIQDMFVDLVEEFVSRRPGYETVVGSYAALILTRAFRHAHGVSLDPARSRPAARIKPALDHLHANFQQVCSVPGLAARAHLHPVHFARIFKRAMGYPPHVYLARLRIERARRLILNSGLSFTEIAGEVGFNSIHQFSRIFKKIEGLTPTQYLQSVKNL